MRVEKDSRPISLTPVLSKGVEWYVRKWVMEIVEGLLDPHQFGSPKVSSTIISLAGLIHNWLTALEKPDMVVRVLMLDFRKAFDKVDHKILLSKLANTGVPDFLISWIINFLYERQQRIKIGLNTSSWSHLKAGVLQGTLRGSTSFLLHINDLKTICDDERYVDDTTSGSDSSMQTAAYQAVEWMNKNNTELNTEKTKEMSIYFGRKALQIVPVKINGNEIECVSFFKLLGIMINDTNTWNNHIDYICVKASCRIYFLILLKISWQITI